MTAKTIISTARIVSMAKHMPVPEIARRLGIGEEDVHRHLASVGRDSALRWIARCHRTGRELVAFTERGAYIKAQIAGFADWSLVGRPRAAQTAGQGEMI
jgi:hypothetical protein